ncbi:MAG: nucleotidyltransferase family protein [Planctomycetota bacterium]
MGQVVETKDDILRVIQELSDQLRALGVKRLGLFGSFVRGEQTPASDVDMIVEFEAGQKNFDRFMGVAFLLEDTLLRRVDLLTLESLDPYIGPYILKEVEYVPFAGRVLAAHSG